MRSPHSSAVAAFLSFAVLLTLSQNALAQASPGTRGGGLVGGGVPGVRRGMPGAFVPPLRSGFTPGGFRRRFDNGVPTGTVLGPGWFGFPRGDGRFFGAPIGSGFFGFPHRRFGFFIDGFSFFGPFFGGFPFRNGFFFFDGFPFFDGFAFVDGFPVLHRPFFGGFAHRRVGFFGPQRFPLGAAPFGFVPQPWFGFGGDFTGDATGRAGAQATPPRVPDTWPTLGRQFSVSGMAPGTGDSLVLERVSVMDVVPATVLRLTWRSAGLEAAQVALFLADSAQAVLASQTLRGPPFTALLDPPPGTRYAGVTAVWPDGTTTSRLVPYQVRPR